METIERAGKRLGVMPAKSLIEKAVAPLGGVQIDGLNKPEAALAADALPHRPGRDAIRKRATQRQITIDFERLRDDGFALPADQSVLAEELRLIKRPLLSAAFAREPNMVANANLIMVTSTNPKEGKTFIATNLGA